VVYNPNTKKSGGFGFVTIKNDEKVSKIMESEHFIKGARVDLKEALDKTNAKNKEEDEMKRKLFVGALPKNLPDSELKAFFENYGKIEKAYVIKDHRSGKTRGKP
jgi:RNA recognition motif-containing protein